MKLANLFADLGITRQALYRHVSLNEYLRPDGLKLPPQTIPLSQQFTAEIASSCGGKSGKCLW